ncbi:MAG: family element transposase accessory protein TnpB [Cyanobacteriota bacterium]|jgi:putative transposase
MQLVERHIIQSNHPHYHEIDSLCLSAKNLYNYANFHIRQSFIFKNKYIDYNLLAKQLKSSETYKYLPTKVAKQVLLDLHHNWLRFLAEIKAYKEIEEGKRQDTEDRISKLEGNFTHPDFETMNGSYADVFKPSSICLQPEVESSFPSTFFDQNKFLGRPKLPKYKHKEKGRHLLVYTAQAVNKPIMKAGLIHLPQTHIYIPTSLDDSHLQQVRIVPKIDHYVVEVVYEKEELDHGLEQDSIAAIDLGIDNLATLTSNKPGFVPVLVKGQIIKSINRYYNQQITKLKSLLPNHQKTSKWQMLMVV